jgi:hypothetical protein
MTRGPALAAVSLPERTGTAEPEGRLLGVGKRGRSWRRAGRARWPTTPRAFIRTRIARALGRPEPAEQHWEKGHEDDERRIGKRQKVEAAVHPLGHQNRVSLPAPSR